MEMENKIATLCEMQSGMIDCLKSQFGLGIMNIDSKEAGEAADIIKDLAQAEKYMRESQYYKQVSEAMEGKNEFPYRDGYTPTTRGTITTRYGYSKPYMDQEPYINAYLNDGHYPEYGKEYDEYSRAKRHYTETKSTTDKSEMDIHAKRHLDNTVKTIKEMWADASPELREIMKKEIKSLIEVM